MRKNSFRISKQFCRVFLITFLISGIIHTTQAQKSILTLDSAIAKALSSNNNILIAKNNTEIAKQQNTLGNAGYLPSVTSNSNYNLGVNNTTLQFLNSPDPQKIDAARSSSYGTNLAANYTISEVSGTSTARKT